ncbi:hypothetical protein EDB83DRAFT_885157 [Lactarius deliciosus]|nr:hypothetical protein EDB83DRAFT_885157 [Lactarius deliciosus]
MYFPRSLAPGSLLLCTCICFAPLMLSCPPSPLTSLHLLIMPCSSLYDYDSVLLLPCLCVRHLISEQHIHIHTKK